MYRKQHLKPEYIIVNPKYVLHTHARACVYTYDDNRGYKI